jgi:predicted ATP-dependent endonuclease of OLD family
MRSFASVLLDKFTSEYSIMLIDEPEAFLHPPQARLLGKMLATHNPDSRQLFIATHSEDFLQGLLDADNESVIVVRIDRIDDINVTVK